MPEFYIRPMFDRKIFFRAFLWGGGAGHRPSPVSYAYGWAPGPPPAKSGPGCTKNQNPNDMQNIPSCRRFLGFLLISVLFVCTDARTTKTQNVVSRIYLKRSNYSFIIVIM